VVSSAAPIYSKNNLIGVLVLELPIDTLNKLLNPVRIGQNRGNYIIGNDLLFRSDSRFSSCLACRPIRHPEQRDPG